VGNGGVLVDAEPKKTVLAVVARVVGADSAGVRKISSTCWREGGILVIFVDSELENSRIATVPIGSSC
jgi:hypothetical protein